MWIFHKNGKLVVRGVADAVELQNGQGNTNTGADGSPDMFSSP
jgi:hypothetical protein